MNGAGRRETMEKSVNIAQDMTALVGHTPLVRLHRTAAPAAANGAEILAKLEFFNPASSVKDRVALAMVEAAEKRGDLVPMQTPPQVIIEPTSGNTGVGLAFVAAIKGYTLILTMPESMSEERKILLRGMGATLVLTPASGGMAAAVAEAERLTRETPGAFMPGQFSNEDNPDAHTATADEIWHDTDGTVDALVAMSGTSGTITGAGRRLKALNPGIRVYAVEPEESAVLSGGKPGKHGIQGGGPGFVPAILDRSVLDGILTVHSADALAMAKRLIREEGILCGMSSGAAALAAIRLGQRPEFAGKRIVFIAPDTASRYLSTDLFA